MNRRGRDEAGLGDDAYRLLVDSNEVYAMFMIAPDNRILSWNPGVGQIFGYSSAEFIGQQASVIFTPEDVAAGAVETECGTAAERGYAMDDRWHVRKDGSRLWVNGVMTALRGADGSLLGYAKVLRDNTREKEADAALQRANEALESRVAERTAALTEAMARLQESEARLAEVFRAGPFAASLNTAEDDRFVDVNDSFLRLTGYRRDEVIGRTARELGMWSSPEDRRRIREEQDEDGDFQEVELEVRTRDGGVRTILASAVGIGEGDSKVFLKMAYDVTERARSESELMAAIQEVMQDANWFSRSVVEKLAQIRGGNPDTTGVAELTQRERQVLERVARGMSNAEIAAELGIGPQTVRNYVAAVYGKIEVHSRTEAALWARERGLGI